MPGRTRVPGWGPTVDYARPARPQHGGGARSESHPLRIKAADHSFTWSLAVNGSRTPIPGLIITVDVTTGARATEPRSQRC